MKKIVYQGIKGSYSYLSALKKYGLENNFEGVLTFHAVFEAIETNQAEYGIVPIENCLVGSIHENYDLLYRYSFSIIDELYYPVDHSLLTIPELRDVPAKDALKNMRKVFSHPKALEQCRNFFIDHPWIEGIASLNTALAASEVAKTQDATIGAIASSQASDIYGLHILQKCLQDNPNNFTRFVCIAHAPIKDPENNKCSLMLKLRHKPQALAAVLDLFGKNGLNLTKIESRPILGVPFEYVFYLDFEFNGSSPEKVSKILNQVENKTTFLKCLGVYKKETLWKI